MDTVFINPFIAFLGLVVLVLLSLLAGVILSVSAAKAEKGWILTTAFFFAGVGVHLGCLWFLISVISAFRRSFFMPQFISLGIVTIISFIAYRILKASF